MGYLINHIPDFILFFQSLSVWVQFNILFFNSIFLYYSLKWVLFDPQGTGQSFGRWLLRRILMVLAINIQLSFWFEYSACSDIPDPDKTDKTMSPTVKYILLGASTVFLGYCLYKACASFASKTYPSYMDKHNSEVDGRYTKLVEESQRRFNQEQELLAAEYELRMEAEYKIVKSPEEISLFKQKMLEQHELIKKTGEEVHLEIVNQMQKYTKYDLQLFYRIVRMEEYQTFAVKLPNPKAILPDYLFALKKSLHKSMGNLDDTVTLLDLRLYHSYLKFVLIDLRNIDQYIDILGDGQTYESLLDIHYKLKNYNELFECIGSTDFLTRLGGFRSVGLITNSIPINLNYIMVNRDLPTMSSIVPSYIYQPFIAPNREDMSFSFMEVALPIFYDLTIIGSYGFLSICSFMFGGVNPITSEILGYSWVNLCKNMRKLLIKIK